MTEKAVKPEIRFAGFNDAWEQRKLGDVVNVYDGVHKTPDYTDGGIMFLSVENISTLKSEKYISEEAFNRDFKVYPEKGDVLMTRIGDVGTPNVVETTEKVAFYVSLALLKPTDIDSYFLRNSILSAFFQNGLKERTLVTAIPQKINKDEIGKVSLFVSTSIDEQREIGTFFRNLDNLITLHQRKYDKLTKVKKSMLEKMFPKNGANVPEIRFKGFSDAWEQRKLGDICMEMLAGGDIDKEKIVGQGKYPVIANALTNDGIVGFYEHDYRVKSPAVTITGRGDVGHAKARKVDFTPVVRLLAIRTNHDVDFIENAINTLKVTVESTGVPQLTVPQLERLELFIPPTIAEEQIIGAYLRQLDNLITLHQRELEKLKNIKKACLEKMFV